MKSKRHTCVSTFAKQISTTLPTKRTQFLNINFPCFAHNACLTDKILAGHFFEMFNPQFCTNSYTHQSEVEREEKKTSSTAVLFSRIGNSHNFIPHFLSLQPLVLDWKIDKRLLLYPTLSSTLSFSHTLSYTFYPTPLNSILINLIQKQVTVTCVASMLTKTISLP